MLGMKKVHEINKMMHHKLNKVFFFVFILLLLFLFLNFEIYFKKDKGGFGYKKGLNAG